ncbi:MAG TPA: FAD-binding oxidoreductase, partial [Gemmatimonadaceae bacterium]|nr:FAD-binding oxidoreductase [Gemmatimonadaceae bacterium]
TNTPLIPRGSGSSMAGGAIGPGVIVDLSRMDTIGPIDRDHARVTVGPGAIVANVDRAAATVGLRFPVDPSSWDFCTIGGMSATNAAGAHTLRFGSMRRWVTALDCIFADGTRVTVRRGAPPPDTPSVARLLETIPEIDSTIPEIDLTIRDIDFKKSSSFRHQGVRKESSGYYTESRDLVDLLVGSEGTLALFVGIELALTSRPTATASLLAAFPSLDAAVAGTVAARAVAVACELLDKTFLDVAESGGAGKRLPAGTEAVLLIELEGDDARASAERLAGELQTAGASVVDLALDPAAEHTLWALRHAASPILARLDPALKSMQFIEDAAVPPERLADYVRGVRAALTRHNLRGVIFGHAGDAHMHVNPLIDVRAPDWRARLDAVLTEVTALTARLGGTLTGEHGDGRLRTPLLADVWPQPALDLFARIKHAFDPQGILNPGVKVKLPNQRPVTDVKYDPSLPPLPPSAAAALARVERDRAYARPRLDLLEEP